MEKNSGKNYKFEWEDIDYLFIYLEVLQRPL